MGFDSTSLLNDCRCKGLCLCCERVYPTDSIFFHSRVKKFMLINLCVLPTNIFWVNTMLYWRKKYVCAIYTISGKVKINYGCRNKQETTEINHKKDLIKVFCVDCMNILSPFLDSKDVYVNSFFPRTAGLWNSLPIEFFPLTYDLNGFKSRINSHLLTVGSF